MSWELILVLAAITYGSRAAALVFLPRLPDGVRAVIDRMPPALFAGLAVHSIVAPGGVLADGATLAAPWQQWSWRRLLLAGVPHRRCGRLPRLGPVDLTG